MEADNTNPGASRGSQTRCIGVLDGRFDDNAATILRQPQSFLEHEQGTVPYEYDRLEVLAEMDVTLGGDVG
jgi:hypothetical protein